MELPLGYEEIIKILPHRYPFLLVDRIIELDLGSDCGSHGPDRRRSGPSHGGHVVERR